MGIKIAVCFFGISRSLTFTYPSIETNVLRPAWDTGEVKIFVHFFDQEKIVNVRSGENGPTRRDEHLLLKPDWLQLEPPDNCLKEIPYNQIKSFGDVWRDDFQSLRNLLHQLHSLKIVSKAALDWHPDIIIFARPDLEYHDSLARPVHKILAARGNIVCLPSWQHWEDGYNDRFAVCTADEAAKAYGARLDKVLAFCKEGGRPLHAERLLKFALSARNVKLRMMSVRASRVRLDGTKRVEKFEDHRIEAFREWRQRPWRLGLLKPLRNISR